VIRPELAPGFGAARAQILGQGLLTAAVAFSAWAVATFVLGSIYRALFPGRRFPRRGRLLLLALPVIVAVAFWALMGW
jgi:hypothetical protein